MALINRKAKKAEQKLKALVKGCQIPHFSDTALKVLKLLRDPDACFEGISERLQWDTGLVLRVLKTVNSPGFGTMSRIDDVQHAVSFLGRSKLEQIILALVVKEAVPSPRAPGFDVGRYWHTAALRAGLGRAIADQLHPARSAEAFTSGLLQDIAVPVLAQSQPDSYGEVLEAWHGRSSDSRDNLADLENQAFGWCHAKVGGLLGEVWELPDGLRQSIQAHHASESTDWEVLPSVRLVALLPETQQVEGIEELVEVARADYGLAPDWMVTTVEAAQEHAASLASSLSGT